ncbi:hypothetical protein [Oryzifoliimicrobium ureilyticus]|uniref:hypothetical protein n=1 Tax=Oryzifoliimicrobium ureilyticus TaxID=3113724 RepID=UPI0030761667
MSNEPSSGAFDQVAVKGLRHTLSYLMPDLAPFWARPLAHYASAVYETGARGRCSIRNDAMLRLQAFVTRIALRSGADQYDADEAGRQIAASPVLQTGPHCHLLIEPDAFYTHLFSALGLGAHNLRWHICYGSSTVKFIEKSKRGPGWLSVGGEVLNVFGLPRSRMDPYSICGFNGPYRFKLAGQNGHGRANPAAIRLKAILPDVDFPSAADAIKAANESLWRRWFPPSLRLLQFDDIDVADLVAEHFEDPESWLSSRFSSGDLFAQRLLLALDRLNSGPWAGWVRRTTDFFWGLEDGRLFPLSLRDGVLSGSSLSVRDLRFGPESIAVSLRQRKLVPNLLMMFLVTSILPGVRVLGGCRQTIYYPLMRYLLTTALQSSSDRELLATLRADERPGMWGHRVLRPTNGTPFLEIGEDGSGLEVANKYGVRSLVDTAGDLASFTGDPIWAKLSAHIRTGRIHPASAEWLWV